jgi:hypothetical protein
LYIAGAAVGQGCHPLAVHTVEGGSGWLQQLFAATAAAAGCSNRSSSGLQQPQQQQRGVFKVLTVNAGICFAGQVQLFEPWCSAACTEHGCCFSSSSSSIGSSSVLLLPGEVLGCSTEVASPAAVILACALCALLCTVPLLL